MNIEETAFVNENVVQDQLPEESTVVVEPEEKSTKRKKKNNGSRRTRRKRVTKTKKQETEELRVKMDQMNFEQLCTAAVDMYKYKSDLQRQLSDINKEYKYILDKVKELMGGDSKMEEGQKKKVLVGENYEIMLTGTVRDAMVTKKFLQQKLKDFCAKNVDSSVDPGKMSSLMTEHVMDEKKDAIRGSKVSVRKCRKRGRSSDAKKDDIEEEIVGKIPRKSDVNIALNVPKVQNILNLSLEVGGIDGDGDNKGEEIDEKEPEPEPQQETVEIQDDAARNVVKNLFS